MKRNQSVAFLLAAMISCAAHAAVPAPAYKAQLIPPPGGYAESRVTNIDGSTIVGEGRGPNTGGNYHALIWDPTTQSVVDLTPPGFNLSVTSDSWGNSQVGYVSSATIVGHAALWYGSAESFVDLHRPEYYGTTAHAVWNNFQVGAGRTLAELEDRALLWSGSAASAINLHPAGFKHSVARDVEGNTQVGDGFIYSPEESTSHALLWRGSAVSAVDLHPAGFSHSIALGLSEDTQVGYGQINPSGGPTNALLWRGAAESVVNLHPAGFFSSYGHGVTGDWQVGYGRLMDTMGAPGENRALLWNGTAESVVNLHQYLAGIPMTFTNSFAFAIDANGRILGTARGSSRDRSYAILWTPIPEPSSALLFIVGLAAMRFARTRRRYT
ncbi:MAG TPA: hypothetical protein VGK58_04075 [Lacipirellulaceae bacterium]